MGLVDKIKSDVKKAGANKGKFIYFREGQKQRVRFLTDMDDGMEVTFHDSFEQGINVLVRSLWDAIARIAMMTVCVHALSTFGQYGITTLRKFSCSCSL